MTLTLSSIAPSVDSSPNWKTVGCTGCGSNFKYNLDSDWTTWQTWAYEVAEPNKYFVSQKETDNE